MSIFKKKEKCPNESNQNRIDGFEYLDQKYINMDSACQTMRPTPVINALNDYYHKYNACGERVQYKWGNIVDEKVKQARQSVLDYLNLSNKDYVVSFTLNTTYGLNLLLNQLPCKDQFKKIVTSEIEHNSVFLSTMSYAKNNNIPRLVLDRDQDGDLLYKIDDIKNAIVVVNATSNIDGRLLLNIKSLINDAHNNGGIVIIDAAQTMALYKHLIESCQADAICFSAHKMYSASLGGIIAKKSLVEQLDISFIGGGMVSTVYKDNKVLLPNLETRLEPGLQEYGEILALNEAIKWLNNNKNNKENLISLSKKLFEELNQIDGLKLINKKSSTVISAYFSKLDSNLVAKALSNDNIMVRSGYFCCHYYLINKMNYPKLLRFSLGLNNNLDDINKVILTMKKISEGNK